MLCFTGVISPGVLWLSCFLFAVAVMEVSELDEGQVSVETLQDWCVEEQAMETDIALLQQVEELERKVTSASLQVKVSVCTASRNASNRCHFFH